MKIIHCDRCKQYPAKTVTYVAGYSPDPASGKTESDLEYIDLCEQCHHLAFQRILQKLGRSAEDTVMEVFRNMKKEAK